MNNVVSIALLAVLASFTSNLFGFTWLELGHNLNDFDTVINFVSITGSIKVIACLALILAWLYAKNKKQYLQTIVRFLFLILMLIVCVLSLKSLVEVKRPFHALITEQNLLCDKEIDAKCKKTINVSQWQKSHWVHESRFSLPSGHAAFTFFIATFFSLLLYKKGHKLLVISLFIWAVFVSYSRLLIGVHWPLDILIGAVMGVGFAYLNSINFKRY
jgi:membrane-associated phospholipid phosphatase